MSAAGDDAPFGPPAWGLSVAAAGLATLAVCWPAWPGFMSYDSLFAFEQGRSGVATMLWPPLHAYLFRLSLALGAGAGGVFAAQTFTLFLGAALAISMTIRPRRLAALAILAFLASFVCVPAQLGVLSAQWRDVPTASFTLLGLAFWMLAARRRGRLLLVAAVAALCSAVALRYNAILLAAPLLALILWRPFAQPGGGAGRATALAAAVLGLSAAWASTHWRLPDLAALPPPKTFGATQEFDLIGVSACADKSYLPLAISGGEPLTGYQIRSYYDPRHLQLSLAGRPGLPALTETDAQGETARRWLQVLRQEPLCYLAHRALVFAEQMGVAAEGVFYPVHGRIDPNRFGLRLAHPAAAGAVAAYVERNASEPWRRPALLYLGALLALAGAWAARLPDRIVLSAMVAGAFAYPALLFVAAPAADARYIFPSNVLCALAICLAGAELLAHRPLKPAP